MYRLLYEKNTKCNEINCIIGITNNFSLLNPEVDLVLKSSKTGKVRRNSKMFYSKRHWFSKRIMYLSF